MAYFAAQSGPEIQAEKITGTSKIPDFAKELVEKIEPAGRGGFRVYTTSKMQLVGGDGDYLVVDGKSVMLMDAESFETVHSPAKKNDE